MLKIVRLAIYIKLLPLKMCFTIAVHKSYTSVNKVYRLQ